MIEYKSEILNVSYKLIKAKIKESEIIELDSLLNKRANEGWELVTHSFMGSNDTHGRGILVTFKRDK